MFAQREILGVLVRTIENEHELMETVIKDEATKAILEIQREMQEPKCKEMEDDCLLGLGEPSLYILLIHYRLLRHKLPYGIMV